MIDFKVTAEHLEEYRHGIRKKKSGEIPNPIPFAKVTLDPNDIDWSQYDIVIAMDAALQPDVMEKYPEVRWVYTLSDPDWPAYHSARDHILEGYEFWINMMFRRIRLFPQVNDYEIEFPYHLHYYGCFHDLLGIGKDHYKREGIFLENRTYKGLREGEMDKLQMCCTIRYPKEELLEKVIDKELLSKYFISLTRGVIGKMWGNGIVEAVACGCLAFGDYREYYLKDLLTGFTRISSIEEFIDKVDYLEKHPARYQKEIDKQRKILDYLCFYRPVKDLFTKTGFLGK